MWRDSVLPSPLLPGQAVVISAVWVPDSPAESCWRVLFDVEMGLGPPSHSSELTLRRYLSWPRSGSPPQVEPSSTNDQVASPPVASVALMRISSRPVEQFVTVTSGVAGASTWPNDTSPKLMCVWESTMHVATACGATTAVTDPSPFPSPASNVCIPRPSKAVGPKPSHSVAGSYASDGFVSPAVIVAFRRRSLSTVFVGSVPQPLAPGWLPTCPMESIAVPLWRRTTASSPWNGIVDWRSACARIAGSALGWATTNAPP